MLSLLTASPPSGDSPEITMSVQAMLAILAFDKEFPADDKRESLAAMSSSEDVFFDALENEQSEDSELEKHSNKSHNNNNDKIDDAASAKSDTTEKATKVCEASTDKALGVRGGHDNTGGGSQNNGNNNNNNNNNNNEQYQTEFVAWTNGQSYQQQNQQQQINEFHPPPPPYPPQQHHYDQLKQCPPQEQQQQQQQQQESNQQQEQFVPRRSRDYHLPPPPPPQDVPERFIRAAKGDPAEARRRYDATLAWRKENEMDYILNDAFPDFELIKSHYPHFYHMRGKNGEPVFYEQPPRTNLAALRQAGVNLKQLLRHYAMITEFQWQYIERDDFARSITVIDLKGMRMTDFVGECVDYVRKCSEFTGQHYPERAGYVLVLNVPSWFKIIWNVVKPMVDEVTLQKIRILSAREDPLPILTELIPIENIPPEYGGQSMPLGQSPEEELLRDVMRHNIELENGTCQCIGVDNVHGGPPCPFCCFVPARSY